MSDFALRLSEINPEEKEDDIRSEAQNWLLEFKARELQMNLAVAHTMADKMLEAELSDCLEGAKGEQIVTRINGFFDRSFNPHPAIVILPAAGVCSSKERRQSGARQLWVRGEGRRDLCGPVRRGRNRSGHHHPHSLVDAAVMRLWKAAAMSMM